ncbi:MAG TPA: VWA domain-containing protein [Terriglobales bacterium]|nr:VWA domain-containing protein [Terriglobales bacterium]
MPQVNKFLVLLLFLSCTIALSAQQQAPPSTSIGSQEPMAQPPVAHPNPQPPAQAPGAQQAPEQKPQTPPANQGGNGSQQQGAPVDQESGAFIIRKRVEEVTLHATVVDDKQHLVTNLTQNDFTVFEDGQPQQITSFRHEDVPVSVGILIDNSGSMREKRPAVNQAALNLVRASNPQDEVFIVNFNEEPFLDQDYTNNIGLMKEALEHVASRGGTALYDALVAASDHLRKSAKLDKKVLLVVTDGEDNASRETLEKTIRRLAVDGGPTVYTIGLLNEEEHGAAKRAKRALTLLAEQTGGISFFPKDYTDVDNITRQVAHDIRNQYTIGYRPTTPKSSGGFRTVKVEAKAPGYRRLQVRTRTGYYANEGTTASAAKE